MFIVFVIFARQSQKMAKKMAKKVLIPGEAEEQHDDVAQEASNELPDADSIDTSTLKSPILTRQGWLLPKGVSDV